MNFSGWYNEIPQANFSRSTIKQNATPYTVSDAAIAAEQTRIVSQIDSPPRKTQRLDLYERKLAALEALKKSLLTRPSLVIYRNANASIF